MAGARANLAWVYAEKKRWSDAQDEAKRAIDLDPNNAYAHATLAWAYQGMGQPGQTDLALSEYQRSIELNPKLDNSHLALGMAYCDQGVADRAKDELNALTQLHSPLIPSLQDRIKKGCTAHNK